MHRLNYFKGGRRIVTRDRSTDSVERDTVLDERGCRPPIRRGRQRCVEIIKPADLWPFHEFARYLLGSPVSPWYLVQFRIYAESGG